MLNMNLKIKFKYYASIINIIMIFLGIHNIIRIFMQPQVEPLNWFRDRYRKI